MEISARSYFASGVSLAAASAIAFAPLAVPAHPYRVEIPRVTVADIRLAASPGDIEALVANLQAALGNSTDAIAAAVGIPGQTLIGVVSNIVTLLDVGFTGLIDATDNPTIAQSLTILKTLSVDAFAMLHENLGLINPVITTTTAQVGELVTSALTGSLQNALIAVLNVANNPLDPGSYADLLTAGVGSGQLLAGNGLRAIQRLGDGGFAIAGIAVKEVTFQFDNAVTRLGDVITQLGDASDNAIVDAVVGAVKGLVIAPALSVFNLGSGLVQTVLTTANTGFAVLVGGATSIVGSPGSTPQSSGLNAVSLRIPDRVSDDVTPAIGKAKSKKLLADAPVAKDALAADTPTKDQASQDKTTPRAEAKRDRTKAKAAAKAKAARDNHSKKKSGEGGGGNGSGGE